MQQKGVKYGVESMCIGGGMGAAALISKSNDSPSLLIGLVLVVVLDIILN